MIKIMENIHKNPLLKTTREELTRLEEQYGLDDKKKIDANIIEIRDWLKTEKHLVEASKYINDNIIKRMFVIANGSVEATKTKIDKYCTTKGYYPEIFLNKSIDEFDLLYGKVDYVVLPELNPEDLSRIVIVRFLSSDLNDITLLTYLRYIYLIEEYVQSCNFNLKLTLISDYTNFPLSFFLKINPMLLKRIDTFLMKSCGYDVKGMHMVNVPNFVDKLLICLKYSVSKSVSSVIHVHHTYEDLHKHFSKAILPKEYGGDGPSCSVISENWKQTLHSEDGRAIIANSEKLIADETRRTPRKFSEKLFGMLGSFSPFSTDK